MGEIGLLQQIYMPTYPSESRSTSILSQFSNGFVISHDNGVVELVWITCRSSDSQPRCFPKQYRPDLQAKRLHNIKEVRELVHHFFKTIHSHMAQFSIRNILEGPNLPFAEKALPRRLFFAAKPTGP
uniref:Uncharacterized protein n=1 Tax=Photinus pyralis TaxID=7054 RepID=A0A1Y1L4J1_PHOPY